MYFILGLAQKEKKQSQEGELLQTGQNTTITKKLINSELRFQLCNPALLKYGASKSSLKLKNTKWILWNTVFLPQS